MATDEDDDADDDDVDDFLTERWPGLALRPKKESPKQPKEHNKNRKPIKHGGAAFLAKGGIPSHPPHLNEG